MGSGAARTEFPHVMDQDAEAQKDYSPRAPPLEGEGRSQRWLAQPWRPWSDSLWDPVPPCSSLGHCLLEASRASCSNGRSVVCGARGRGAAVFWCDSKGRALAWGVKRLTLCSQKASSEERPWKAAQQWGWSYCSAESGDDEGLC